MKVLVIDDNKRLAEGMKQRLQKWFIVELAFSGDEGLTALVHTPFDIVLLDLGLPDAPGIEVCRRIRDLSPHIPILVVTGIDTTLSRVELLETGADDYITKPFDIAELHARINALLRRKQRNAHSTQIIVGDLVITPDTRMVTRANTPIHLRRKEFDILEYLARNKGRVLSRQMIVDHAWSSTSNGWVGSVDVHIKQLRDKVDKPFGYPLIRTIYGVGYLINDHADRKK
ncbi:MAG TPA: response regulator transcription factor [Dongiaceae bacterium]|nr:response regulator transcription factor [Dongiaceae bacterium]